MYHVDDFVIYGSNGVCKVKDIGVPDFMSDKNDKKYYILKPMFSKGSTIYAPVENPKVGMRRILTKEETKELIYSIPSISPINGLNNKIIEGKYKDALNTLDCKEWIKIIKTIYKKNEEKLSQNKKICQTDERYMKQAEELLYSELAIALDMPRDEVKDFIAQKIEGLEKEA